MGQVCGYKGCGHTVKTPGACGANRQCPRNTESRSRAEALVAVPAGTLTKMKMDAALISGMLDCTDPDLTPSTHEEWVEQARWDMSEKRTLWDAEHQPSGTFKEAVHAREVILNQLDQQGVPADEAAVIARPHTDRVVRLGFLEGRPWVADGTVESRYQLSALCEVGDPVTVHMVDVDGEVLTYTGMLAGLEHGKAPHHEPAGDLSGEGPFFLRLTISDHLGLEGVFPTDSIAGITLSED